MRSKAKWTVMVYLAGDNNLEGAAMVDLKEMMKVGSTHDVNIVAQIDRENDNITKRIKILKKGQTSPAIILPETDTGDPAVLADFLLWSVGNYPADHYMLVLWNHGGGWWEDERSGRRKRLSFFKHAHPAIGKRGICYDDTSNGDCLDNAELKKTLTGFSTLIGKKLDILGMDACLNFKAPVRGLFAGDETVTPNGASDIMPYVGRKRALGCAYFPMYLKNSWHS